MEIIEMLGNYGFITVEGTEIIVNDSIGFDFDWSEIYDEEYDAMDEEELNYCPRHDARHAVAPITDDTRHETVGWPCE